MSKIEILKETPKSPITLIGERAGICWGADISDDAKNYKRGLSCLKDNHGRTLEYVCVDLIIDGYSARVMREWYTHIGGAPTRLQASTRYINYSALEDNVIYPPSIKTNDEAFVVYKDCILNIQDSYKKLIELGIKKEDVANILPLGMCTKVVDHRNLRNYIDMAENRKCNRAYWEFRKLFNDICTELRNYSDEWAYIVDNYFLCKCDKLGYCPESRGCGKYKHKGADNENRED